jgi:hypothetical protein
MNRADHLTSDEQILARATKHAIQAAGGLEVCASETGLSTSQLSRCCSPHERDSLTIRDANTIEAIGNGAAGHPHILRALARLQGYVLIKTPEAHGDTDGLLQSVMELTVELGDVASSIHEAMRDSDFKPSEAVRSIEQLDELDEASAKLRLKLKAIADSPNKR